MKKLLLIILGLYTLINAQGITNTLGGNTAADKFIVENSDSEAGLVVTGEGNVGIGITSPEGTLHITQYGDDSKQLVIGNENQPSSEWFLQVDNSANFSINKEGVSISPLYIRNNGNVGIGTPPLQPKLAVVNGDVGVDAIYGESGRSIGAGVSGRGTGETGYGVRGTGNGSSGIGVYGKGEGSTGYGVVGLANSYSGVNYGGKFTSYSSEGTGVHGESGKYGIRGRAFASSGIHYGGFFETENPSGRGVYATSSTSSGSAYGGVFEATKSPDGVGVYAAGKKWDFYAAGAGTDYHSASSKRWKRNIVEIDNPLEKLSQLRGVYYDWDEEHGGEHDLGCIAEEVGKVLPEIVTYEENGIDAEGMDYSKLTPLLIEAIKALEKRVTELENQ